LAILAAASSQVRRFCLATLRPEALQPCSAQPAACSLAACRLAACSRAAWCLQPCSFAACGLAACRKDSKLTRAETSTTPANVGLRRPSLLQPCSPATSSLGRRHWPKAFKLHPIAGELGYSVRDLFKYNLYCTLYNENILRMVFTRRNFTVAFTTKIFTVIFTKTIFAEAFANNLLLKPSSPN
jgi:hypothetical protein